MRAYLAILKDSFREALSSRVLWIAIIGILLLLLALAPFGLRTDRSYRVRQEELVDAEGLARELKTGEAANSKSATPASHLWTLLTDDNRKRINDWMATVAPAGEKSGTAQKAELSTRAAAKPAEPAPAQGPHGRQRNSPLRQMIRLVNDLLKKPEFYDEAAWKNVTLDDETRSMITANSSEPNELSLKNLRLLAAAFPRQIVIQDDPALTLTYVGADVIGPIDLLPDQFARLLDAIIVTVLSVFLGFFGVFGSLLVTAAIIPRTYEPGEISLLMSKPISRSLLFLTKFLGGCSFTFLCGTILVTGVWLLLGVRLGFWRAELLWCIPIYVFVFAVYYSVSALTGVIWRNAVVSLIVTGLFWALLVVVGFSKGLIEENVIKSRRITEITVAGPDVFVVDGSHSVHHWDSDASDWKEVFRQSSGGVPRFFRRMMLSGSRFQVVWDRAGERILALQTSPSQFGGASVATVVSGTAEGNWEREVEGQTPEPVFGMFADSTGRIILPGRRAIHVFSGLSEQQKQAQKFLGGVLNRFMGGGRKAFEEIQPAEMTPWSSSAVAAFHPSNDVILMLDRGHLHRLDRGSDGRYQTGLARDLKTADSAVMACSGRHVLLAFGSGRILVLNSDTFDSVAETQLPDESVPRTAEAAPDGSRMAVLTHDNRIVVFDGTRAQFSDWSPAEQGRAAAVAFDHSSHLVVSNGRRSLAFYAPGSNSPARSFGGTTDMVYRIYDYLVSPLYTVLPRPSDMDNAVRWLVTGERSVVIGDESNGPFGSADRSNLQRDRITFDLRKPVLANTAFIVIMLTIGCVYVARRDF